MKPTEHRSRKASQRFALAGLLFLSLAVRAVTPAGYMPGSIAGGSPFVLCPNSTPGAGYFLERSRGQASQHHHHHQHDSGEATAETPWEFCPFGVALTPAAPVAEPLPHRLEPAAFVAAAPPVVILRTARERTFRARGPPVIAA